MREREGGRGRERERERGRERDVLHQVPLAPCPRRHPTPPSKSSQPRIQAPPPPPPLLCVSVEGRERQPIFPGRGSVAWRRSGAGIRWREGRLAVWPSSAAARSPRDEAATAPGGAKSRLPMAFFGAGMVGRRSERRTAVWLLWAAAVPSISERQIRNRSYLLVLGIVGKLLCPPL